MSAGQGFDYAGSELELFQAALNWKNYFGRSVRPWLGARVLEVGAGIGGTTEVLCDGAAERWLCLEPDAAQCQRIRQRIDRGELPGCCVALAGTLAALDAGARFDTILYMDVLEHIEDDRGELARAAALLAPGGRLVVLAPAHPWLYTPFDAAIGHYRRYTRQSLLAAAPPALEVLGARYLDAVGTCLSAANRLLLRRSMPSAGNIRFWDRCVVPLSRWVDPLLRYSFGKSVLVVWRKRAA